MRHRRALFLAGVTAIALAAGPCAGAAEGSALVDDFSDRARMRSGAERLLVDDRGVGGKSQATQRCVDGKLLVAGELVPARGMPGFISVPLLVAPDAAPRDLSAFEGIRLRVRVTRGSLSVQAGSSEVDNFDYHTSAPLTRDADEFKEVRLPFRELKRGWSGPTPLNPRTITSVNLVAFGLSPATFAFEVDEVGFY